MNVVGLNINTSKMKFLALQLTLLLKRTLTDNWLRYQKDSNILGILSQLKLVTITINLQTVNKCLQSIFDQSVSQTNVNRRNQRTMQVAIVTSRRWQFTSKSVNPRWRRSGLTEKYISEKYRITASAEEFERSETHHQQPMGSHNRDRF